MSLLSDYKILYREDASKYNYYVLIDNNNNKFFAKELKILNVDNVYNFENEIKMNLLFQHCDFIPKMKLYNLDSQKIIVYSFVEGKTLKNSIFSEFNCLKIAILICDMLKVFHSNNFIYGDIKPSNFILNETLKLIDLGNVTKIGAKLEYATLKYCSPYQKREKTARVEFDFYSLGVLLYELLYGKKIFDNNKKINWTYLALDNKISRELKQIIIKLTVPNVNYNYRKIEDIKNDLLYILNKNSKKINLSTSLD